jgi:hypothetical protein
MCEVACVVTEQLIEVAPELTAFVVAYTERDDDVEKCAEVFTDADLPRFDPVLMKT